MKLKTTITLILITLLMSVFAFSLMSVFAFSPSKKGYKLVWQDNFSSKNIDTKSWTHEVARSGWVNNEKQRYTDGENAVQKKGKLILTARYENNEYTSARMITENKRMFTYGYFEIKAKLPAKLPSGNGTWPALWMLGNNNDQVGWPQIAEN